MEHHSCCSLNPSGVESCFLKIVLELFAWSLRHLTFSNIRMQENAQFAIKYCFLILHNGYSSTKCVDSAINLISLKKWWWHVQRQYSESVRTSAWLLSTYCFQPTCCYNDVSCFILMLLYQCHAHLICSSYCLTVCKNIHNGRTWFLYDLLWETTCLERPFLLGRRGGRPRQVLLYIVSVRHIAEQRLCKSPVRLEDPFIYIMAAGN